MFAPPQFGDIGRDREERGLAVVREDVGVNEEMTDLAGFDAEGASSSMMGMTGGASVLVGIR